MKRWFGIPLLGAVMILSSGCVTRSKHASTIADWEDKLTTSELEKKKLKEDTDKQLAGKDQQLKDLKDELDVFKQSATSKQKELLANLKASKAEIDALRRQREKIEANLRQYRGLREAFQKMIGAGEIEIYRRRGHIMVALPSSVLFPSGKASLSSAGKRALVQVAGVLSKVENRNFLVAGHTDDVPIKTSKFEDNWDLSAARATMVTRFLIENGMAPSNLAAAGYGQHDPLRPNSNSTNRRKNRRIEIILMPNIDELPELPE